MFFFNQEETKVVTIDGYEDVGESDSDLLCANVQQPISVGIDGSAWDFQLYTGVSLLAAYLILMYSLRYLKTLI